MIFYRSEFENGAFWQVFSSQFAHLSVWHGVSNYIILVASLWLLARWIPSLSLFLCFGGGLLGVAVMLVLDSQCLYYAGLSGAVHGLWAGSALLFIVQSPVCKLHGIVILCFLFIKILTAIYFNSNLLMKSEFPVYHGSHLGGALGGMIMGFILIMMRKYTKD